MKRSIYLTLLLAAGISMNATADIQLPSVFSDGMVLQQKSKTNIWGWGDPADQLSIIAGWNTADTLRTTVNNQGKWQIELPTVEAGGPYSIEIQSNKESHTISDVLLGEVWLCSGQSNMEWSANMGIMNGDEEIKNADCSSLRILHMPKQGANAPQADCRTAWETASPTSMARTSATAYFFGRYLTENLNVPVGIIVAAWGGTPAEVWTPAEVVKNDKILASQSTRLSKWWPNVPGVLYNQMINPVIPYTIAGCIWYQGESNHENAETYELLMEKMVNSWRSRFGQNFPFYYVQIAPHTYHSTRNTPAILREQQELMLSHVDNCAMINISDLVENVSDIHPRNKRAIGERLAFLAMDKNYGRFMKPYSSPSAKSATVEGNNIIIEFNGDFESFKSTEKKEIVGISVTDASGKAKDVTAKIKGKQLQISAKGLIFPVEITYCFDDATIGSLRTDAGLPFLPFRLTAKK